MIVLSNVTKRYGAKILFENVSVQLDPGKRYGVTGANGAGKSTLLEMLAAPGRLGRGEHRHPAGAQDRRPRAEPLHLRRAAHPRHRHGGQGRALGGDGREGEAPRRRGRRRDRRAPRRARGRHRRARRLHRPRAKRRSSSSVSAFRSRSTSSRCGRCRPATSSASSSRRCSSGGPDVMLLDEPTNHLDLESIHWLSRFLVDEHKGTLLVVSHDRHFLNSVATHIADVDLPHDHHLHGQLRRVRGRQVREPAARGGDRAGRQEEDRRAAGLRAALRVARLEEQAGPEPPQADREARGRRRDQGRQALEPRPPVRSLRVRQAERARRPADHRRAQGVRRRRSSSTA